MVITYIIHFRLLDVIISESSEKLNNLLYDKYFNDKLADLTVHHNGNFTIQKILSTTADATKVIIKLKEFDGLTTLLALYTLTYPQKNHCIINIASSIGSQFKTVIIFIFSLKQFLIN